MDTLPLGLAEPAELYLPSTADRIARGVCRRLGELGYRTLLEFRVGLGRRADVAGLDAAGRFVIVEVKSSTADFRADAKWHDYLGYCDAYYFAVADDFPREILPAEHGLIVADEHDAAILREAPSRTMPAARRRAQILRFGLVAAQRLSFATGYVRPDQDWRED
jgi:hypothetical protein